MKRQQLLKTRAGWARLGISGVGVLRAGYQAQPPVLPATKTPRLRAGQRVLPLR